MHRNILNALIGSQNLAAVPVDQRRSQVRTPNRTIGGRLNNIIGLAQIVLLQKCQGCPIVGIAVRHTAAEDVHSFSHCGNIVIKGFIGDNAFGKGNLRAVECIGANYNGAGFYSVRRSFPIPGGIYIVAFLNGKVQGGKHIRYCLVGGITADLDFHINARTDNAGEIQVVVLIGVIQQEIQTAHSDCFISIIHSIFVLIKAIAAQVAAEILMINFHCVDPEPYQFILFVFGIRDDYSEHGTVIVVIQGLFVFPSPNFGVIAQTPTSSFCQFPCRLCFSGGPCKSLCGRFYCLGWVIGSFSSTATGCQRKDHHKYQ